MAESPELEQRPRSREAAVAGGSEDVEVRTPAPRPRKKHTASKRDGGSAPARRKRRSKRSQDEPHQRGTQSETVITTVLGDLQDDIVEGLVGDIEPGGIPMPPMGSSNGNTVYVQRVRGFSQATREKVLCAGPAPEEGVGGGGTVTTPLSTAIAIQEHLRPFYTLCHGLLGGLALSLLLMSYSSGNLADEATRFVVTLSPFIRVAGTVFYFFAAVCTVSVFDRIDVSNMDCGHIVDVVKYQGVGIIVVAVYLFTLVNTLVCAQWDDGIALYRHNGSHWSGDQELMGELEMWHTLNTCRCVGGMLGWFLVAMAPARDLLRDHLAAMLPYQASPAS